MSKLEILKLPPNKANIKILSKLQTPQQVTSKLKKLKIAPSDLKPVDWRKIMQEAGLELSPPKNQQQCGNCWAVSSTQALTDRFMWRKKLRGLNLTPILTTQCVTETFNKGCGGGIPALAGVFFEQNGLVQVFDGCPDIIDVCNKDDENCKDGLGMPTCSTIEKSCYKENVPIFKALVPRSAENRPQTTLAATDAQTTIFNMKAELQDRNYGGPFVCSYFVAYDFMASGIPGFLWQKTNGIYINGAYEDELNALAAQHPAILQMKPQNAKWGDIEGGHAVVCVGWDVDYNVPGYGKVEYWIVRNSWGPNWGEGGYFRIAMNNDPAGKGYNWKLGFDVPVLTDSGYFGSSTVVDPDVSTGNVTPDDGPRKQDDEEKTSMTLLYLGLAIFLFLIFGYVIYRYSK